MIVGSTNDEIVQRIYQILSKVITNMEMELKQNLFHWVEAPEGNEINESIQPLITFLQKQLEPYGEFLILPNLQRFVETKILEKTQRAAFLFAFQDSSN